MLALAANTRRSRLLVGGGQPDEFHKHLCCSFQTEPVTQVP